MVFHSLLYRDMHLYPHTKILINNSSVLQPDLTVPSHKLPSIHPSLISAKIRCKPNIQLKDLIKLINNSRISSLNNINNCQGGVGDGQGSLAYGSPGGCRELDTTEGLG